MKSPKAKLPHSGGALKSLALLVLAALLILASGCTVVRISDGKIISGGQEEDAYLASDEFDAEAYVERIWASEVLPYVSENARDYTELAAQLKQDFAKTGEAYGSTHSSNANNYSFIVKTTARALNYNNESRTGYVSADIAPYDSKEDFKIYVGPVFKGDSLRNALSFIKFTNFQSQSDWAKVSKSLHNKVTETVIEPIDLAAITGKTMELTGTFTAMADDEEYMLTPVVLTITEG